MTVEFYEYTVTPNWEDKNQYNLLVKNGVIYCFDIRCSNKKDKDVITKLCKEQFEIAQELSQKENLPYRGGRQKRLILTNGIRKIEINGSGTSVEVECFYNQFLSELQKFIVDKK